MDRKIVSPYFKRTLHDVQDSEHLMLFKSMEQAIFLARLKVAPSQILSAVGETVLKYGAFGAINCLAYPTEYGYMEHFPSGEYGDPV